MKIKKSFLLLLIAVICIGCFSACGNENVYGFNKEEKQAITASMEVGLSEETFELSLGILWLLS